jgi:non-ribosomal peptide synthetase component F
VALNHRSFIDFTEWALAATGIGEHEVVGSISPIVFDIYSFELCMMFAAGSTLTLIPETLSAFPARILQLLRQRRVSFIFWVPTIMVSIANMGLLPEVPLPDLKMVWFAGEVFPTKQFNIWRANLPGARFVNLYGPIEITLDCTYFIVDRELSDDEPIPIGFPCRNTDILILKDDDTPAEDGVDGELCVRGTSLAMGYYNNPEKTAAAFVQNPLNPHYPEIIYRTGDIVCRNERGEILFKGRKDTLIKHSGYRIELGEVEHVIINALGLVRNGCAVYDYDKKQIVFYYEAESDISEASLRKDIAGMLPRYMIPAVFIRVDQIPRNTNGKIDRLSLKEMAHKV